MQIVENLVVNFHRKIRKGGQIRNSMILCKYPVAKAYDEEEARQQCEDRMNFIEQYFEEKMPADDAAADVGYCCG